jgi:tetratricopeptide (TPR) repeat protein
VENTTVRATLKILTLALLVVVNAPLLFAQEASPRSESYENGRVAAAEDLKRGMHVIQTAGMLMPNNYPWPTREDIYESILEEKYQISFMRVAGCTMETEEAEYMDGYNEASLAGIEAIYGKGIWGKVRRQAGAEYEAKYGEKEREHDGQYRESLNKAFGAEGAAGLAQGEFAEALAAFDEAIKADPNDASAYEHSGDAYARLGQAQEAREAWGKALSLSGNAESKARLKRKLSAAVNQ